jgi:uncharacterized repeat protein (TIGR01451 family)
MQQTWVLTDGIRRKIVAAAAALLLIFTLVVALPVAVPSIATTANALNTLDPSIDLVKPGTLDKGGDGVATPGDIINYTFTVTNTGNTTLTDITVADVVSGVTVTGAAIPSLAPGASNNTVYTGTYAITQADIDAGLFDNTAKACDDSQLCDPDEERVPIPTTPGLDIDKVTNGPDGPNVSVGEAVTWTYTVTNNSNVTLTNIL